MTSLPADSARLDNRGRLQEGKAADIVVLDMAELADEATDQEPQAHPRGIALVVVNGEIVLQHGEHSNALPGQRLPN
jgi:N-acyl-D-amino-acid deacylase